MPAPRVSADNLIENVTVTKPGRADDQRCAPGGTMDGIVVTNAMGEVRNNVVEGYHRSLTAAGSWTRYGFTTISPETLSYGFNADSLTNNNVILESNQFIHPARYGIVYGRRGHRPDLQQLECAA